MEKSVTNSKWKHELGCKATYTKKIVTYVFGAFHGNAIPLISSGYD